LGDVEVVQKEFDEMLIAEDIDAQLSLLGMLAVGVRPQKDSNRKWYVVKKLKRFRQSTDVKRAKPTPLRIKKNSKRLDPYSPCTLYVSGFQVLLMFLN
jgi:hypothetical protein